MISFSTPAIAGHCPIDLTRIDEAVSNAVGLSNAQLTEIKTLRDEGEMLHKSGNHGDSLTALHAALQKLGIDPH
ncbi:MAG: hypothetical protein HRU33_07880 [Rhodobacteraceae bacterium]|nr:hypothetical protein [Paracoccaceae bacterium]